MSSTVTVPHTDSPMHAAIAAYVQGVIAADPARYTGRWSYHVFIEEIGGSAEPHIFRSMDEQGVEYTAEEIEAFNGE